MQRFQYLALSFHNDNCVLSASSQETVIALKSKKIQIVANRIMGNLRKVFSNDLIPFQTNTPRRHSSAP